MASAKFTSRRHFVLMDLTEAVNATSTGGLANTTAQIMGGSSATSMTW